MSLLPEPTKISDSRSLPSAEELDLIRSLLCAFTFSDPSPRPVHSLALSSELQKRNRRPHSASVGLEVLGLLGDAQRLPGGFWLPTGSRIVPTSGGDLIVSGTASQQLKAYGAISQAPFGAARYVKPTGKCELPQQSPVNWLGCPDDSIAWGRNLLQDRHGWFDCSRVRPLEFYRHWPASLGRWVSVNEVPRPLPSKYCICRSPERGLYHYYIGRTRDGRVGELSDFRGDRDARWRLQIVLASLNATPERYFVETTPQHQKFEITVRPLPAPETRLFLSVSRVEVDEVSRQWHVTGALVQLEEITRALSRLGMVKAR